MIVAAKTPDNVASEGTSPKCRHTLRPYSLPSQCTIDNYELANFSVTTLIMTIAW